MNYDIDYEVRDQPLESDPGVSVRITIGEGVITISDLHEGHDLLEMTGRTVVHVDTEINIDVLAELVRIATIELARDADRLRAREEAEYVMQLHGTGNTPGEIAAFTKLDADLVEWIIRQRGCTPNRWTQEE
jgi:hypothetical protein